jgi:hypothetical protein
VNNEKTNEEINQIITEKLFGECWHEYIDAKSSEMEGERCGKCGLSRFEILRRRLDVVNFLEPLMIIEARGKIAEKGLQSEFVNALMLEVGLTESHKWEYLNSQEIVDFDLIHSKPIFQARAIVRVLENL